MFNNTIRSDYWLHAAIVISFNPGQLFHVHAVLTFPCQKLILLWLNEKVDAFERRTGTYVLRTQEALVMSCLEVMVYFKKHAANSNDIKTSGKWRE